MTRRLLMVGVFVSSATVALAQDSYRHGRVLSVEPGVTLQRASEPGAEEAFPNLPFLPGDRVWTDRAGRAEFQFADGTVLRLDSASKLDYVAHDDRGGDRVVLRLWSGGLYLHNRDGRGYPDFGIETPGGVVEARVRGVYRVDVQAGETRLSAYEGEASLEAEREVRVSAGERAYARQGQPTDDPRGFDQAALDDFDQWDADREARGQAGQAYAANRREYLPDTVLPYAGELDAYGSWYYQSEIGHVWRPYVGAGWRPYFDGRWVWTIYGWTWVPNERWGWAPFHYGRWEYTPMLGWYWIPGNAWGPAWVSWAVGPDYVGWCPIGHRNRRVVYEGRRGERGRAVPRLNVPSGREAWTYVRRADFGTADLARRIEDVLPAGHEVHTMPVAHARPGHDLATVETGTGAVAVPRNVRTRFGPGDTAPELRTDPATTIPFPTARRRHRDTDDDGARPAASVHPATTGPAAPAPHPAAPRPEPVHPTDIRPRQVYVPASPAARDRETAHPTDGDREVLRRVFGPLSQPRPADAGDRPAPHARPADGGDRPSREGTGGVDAARPAPRAPEPHAAPAPAAPRAGGHDAATARAGSGRPAPSGHADKPAQKDKDH